MEVKPNLCLPMDDQGSWPTRLNHAFEIGHFTGGNEVEAQRRGQMLAELASDWINKKLVLGPMPNEEEIVMLCSLMKGNKAVELVSFADYQTAAEAPEGTRDHAALEFYKDIVGLRMSFDDTLLSHGISYDHPLPIAEVFAGHLLGTVEFFRMLEGTHFNKALAERGFGHLAYQVFRAQATCIAKDGSGSPYLDKWLTVMKKGWVYLGYHGWTLPRFLYQ